MAGETPNSGPEIVEKSSMTRLLEEYTQAYQRILQREASTPAEDLRRRLNEFRQQQNLPELNDAQRESEDFLRKMLAATDPSLEPIRQRMVAVIFEKIENAAPEKRDRIFQEVFDALKENEAVDLFLVDELIKRRLESVTNHMVGFLKNPDQTSPESIQNGLRSIETSAEQEQTTPQEMAFGMYAFSLFVEKKQPDLIRQLALPENKNIQTFARLTFPSYQEYLQSKGLDVTMFCPNLEWYQKLCERTQVEDQIASIDVQNYPVVDAFNGHMEAQAQAWERQAEEFLKVPGQERMAIEFENRAEAIRDLGKRIRDSVETISIAPSIQPEDIEVTPAFERLVDAPLETLSGVVERPTKIVEGFFDLLHQPIEGASWAMDKVGNWIQAPQFRDMTADSLLLSSGKLALLLAAAVNMAGVGVSTWNSGAKLLRSIIVDHDPKAALAVIPEYLKNIWNVLPSTGVTTATALFFATRDGDLHDLDQWIGERYDEGKALVKRAAGSEYFTGITNVSRDVIQWTQIHAEPYLGKMKEGFDEFIWENATEFYQDVKTGTGERWEAIKLWAEEVGVNLDKYRDHFQTMALFQDELNTSFQSQNIDINSRTITVSTEKFNEFLLKYIEGNQDVQVPEIKEVSISDIKEMQFISDRSFESLPTNTPPFKPSLALARKFIEQGLWWKNRLTANV